MLIFLSEQVVLPTNGGCRPPDNTMSAGEDDTKTLKPIVDGHCSPPKEQGERSDEFHVTLHGSRWCIRTYLPTNGLFQVLTFSGSLIVISSNSRYL